ncbi:MAG: digeranylgeranylglycerophospholipid reductase [Thermosediminibacterales bacterium]|nr:digeranylgeranylglycerophospholipid reductase [Thermosediminibacterales bacterium]MDK2835344.1 digeranylgeranylglycerophospholipid reductase [Thermosediminibacterales bacterium]
MRIAVVGGGPAGLYSAIEGAKTGIKVTLFEKSKIGDEIRCAEGFLDSLKLLGKPDAGVRFKVENILVKVKKEHKVDVSDVNLWMIDRKEWQNALVDNARKLGVDVLEYRNIKPEDLSKMKQEYDWVIDATGAPSLTSRLYRFKKFYIENCGLTVQYVMEGDFSKYGRNIKVIADTRNVGYYWIFPKGRDAKGVEIANVGFGVFKRQKPFSLWENLNKMIELEKLDKHKIVKRVGGICPVKAPKSLIYDNIILVGDAAGLTSPVHGGGIDLACISGKIAIQAIIEGDVSNYRKRLWKIIGNKLSLEQELLEYWAASDFDSLDSFVSFLSRNKKISSLFLNPIAYSRLLIYGMRLLKKRSAMKVK